jgi:phenylalanyl-tRNA synthetase beta chain
MPQSLLRYDLLCIEGISRALRVFLGKAEPPRYKLAMPAGGEAGLLTVTISPEVRLPNWFSYQTYTSPD